MPLTQDEKDALLARIMLGETMPAVDRAGVAYTTDQWWQYVAADHLEVQVLGTCVATFTDGAWIYEDGQRFTAGRGAKERLLAYLQKPCSP